MNAFVADLVQHLTQCTYDVLLPLCDYTTMAMARNVKTLERHAALPIPSWHALSRAHDKLAMTRLAEERGIPVPATYAPSTIAEVRTLAETLAYPCVTKLRRGAAAVGLRFVHSPAELLDAFGGELVTNDDVYDFQWPIIQEYVPGEIHDVCLLFNRGKIVAALTQCRVKMYPAKGGFGVYNVTTDEPDLCKYAVALLTHLDWHGPAQVEFKMDHRDGRPKLIEVNGRYWGTLGLSIRAGVNFPLLAARMAGGDDICPELGYRVGLRYRWPFPYAIKYARQTDRPWRSVWEFVRPGRGICSDIQLSDPLPHLMAVWHMRTHQDGRSVASSLAR